MLIFHFPFYKIFLDKKLLHFFIIHSNNEVILLIIITLCKHLPTPLRLVEALLVFFLLFKVELHIIWMNIIFWLGKEHKKNIVFSWSHLSKHPSWKVKLVKTVSQTTPLCFLYCLPIMLTKATERFKVCVKVTLAWLPLLIWYLWWYQVQ